MKVMLISFSTLPTLQNYLYNSFIEVEKLGLDVYTVGSSDLRVPIELTDRNILVNTPATPRPSVGSLRASKGELDSILEKIEQIRPDVIHFVNKHVWNYLLRMRAGWRRISAKWVHTFHDPIGHEGDAVRRGVILYHKLIQRQLDAIVVHSQVAHSQTRTVLRPRCLVVQAPLGEKQWADYQPLAEGCAKRALVFGRLNPYKGCEMYPAIFGEIYRLDPEIHIVVAGKPSKELGESLLASIAECPNVTLEAGFIDEERLPAYFNNAAIVLTPYTSMTQSGVLLDAFKRSRTVVAFDIPGMDEFLPSSARKAKAFDTQEYARLVVDLANSPEACEEAGRDAWEFGRERFAPAAMARAFAGTYLELVRGTATVRPS